MPCVSCGHELEVSEPYTVNRAGLSLTYVSCLHCGQEYVPNVISDDIEATNRTVKTTIEAIINCVLLSRRAKTEV